MKITCACVCLVMLIAATAVVHVNVASDDIVLYASDITTLQGNWAKTSSSTSPGGETLSSADAGWSSDTPLASPSDYIEATFLASAATPYHIWLRLRAAADSKSNDAVYVQFADAIDAGGGPMYRIGTTSALTVNLENCSGCGVSGWGWQDRGYWLSESAVVQFAYTGSQRIRIQTRQDGVQLDQIVLSSSNYLSASPGQVTNDSVIVPKASTTTTTSAVSSTTTSTAFTSSAAAIPGTVLAANFDNGGEGVAYHDGTAGNAGGSYRQTDVDLEPSTDGGYDVGWIQAGEWLKYSVNVASTGSYTLAVRVASKGQGGTFHLEMNGADVSGAIAIPDTGAWQSWQTVRRTVTLSAGLQIARVVMDTAGANGPVGNITSLSFASAATSAYSGSPVAIPGTVRASDFDNGGEGVAYHDTTSGNAGGAYRSGDVDLEPSSEGGYNVGWTAPGEWLNYSVTAPAGSYTAQVRVASRSTGGAMRLGFSSASNVWASVTVPPTGGWQNWTTVSVPVTLGAGQQVMTVVFDTAGINLLGVNIIASGTTTPTPAPTPTPAASGNVVAVPAGGNLQAAIDAAQPGDTILLTPGATYAGNFVLPVKSGSDYVTIRSGAADSVLPADGVRITPDYVGRLPKVQGGIAGMPAFQTAPGAHHYRLLFLEIVSSYAENNILALGDGNPTQTSLSQVPHDLIVDRCYIHCDPSAGQKRAIALNSASTAIVNSYISEIKSVMEDAQAIGGWNGPGPYTIQNNYLEAAGENVMFGGADPSIPNLVPSDIAIRQNYMSKQLAWRSQSWVVKNLLELKNAQRVVIDSNLLENNWEAAQPGFAVVFTPRNQDGTAPWAVVQDVQFTNNVVRHVAAGLDVLCNDDANPSQTTNAITIRNNLFLDISARRWGGSGWFLQTLGGRDVTVDHNTVFTDGISVVFADVAPVAGFTFTNNIAPDNGWAVKGTGTAVGSATVAAYYPSCVFRRNVFTAGQASVYPADNFYPPTVDAVQFVDVASGDYRLLASSPYKSAATDGTAIGVNQDALALIPVR